MLQKNCEQATLVFDLALKNTGWALFCGSKYQSSGVLRISGKTVEDRFSYMSYEIVALLDELSPDLVYVECTYKGSKYIVIDPIIRLQKVIKEWCENHSDVKSFRRIPPETWRKLLGFPEDIKRTKDLKKYSVDLVKQYLSITVTDDEADAINVGRAVSQKGLTNPKEKKRKNTSKKNK